MNNDNDFDGFEVVLACTANGYRAYFQELPKFFAVDRSPVHAVSLLYKEWVSFKKTCKEQGKEIPTPLSEQEFSGQFNIRVEKSLHQALALEAVRNNLSLNALINKKLYETTILKNKHTVFQKINVVRDPIFRRVILYFTLHIDKIVGLVFDQSNLGDELEYIEGDGDKIAKDDNALIKLFSTHLPLKQSVLDFISSQHFECLKNNRPTLIPSLIISKKSISRSMHGSGLNTFPKNTEEFIIIKELAGA